MEITIDVYAEIVAAVTLLLVWIALLRSYFKSPKRDERTLALSVTYVFLDFASIARLLGILLLLMGDSPTGTPLVFGRFIYICSVAAMVPLTYFITKIFFVERIRLATYLTAIFALIVSAIYLLVPTSVFSRAPEAPTVWTSNLLVGLPLLLVVSAVFIVLAAKCFQTAGKAKEARIRTKFRLIGLAGVFGVLTFLASVANAVASPDLVPYATAVSWFFAAAAGVVSYVGWERFKGPEPKG